MSEMGMSIAFGNMPDQTVLPLPLKIAHRGLEHWETGAGQLAPEFLNGVLSVMNNRAKEREFLRSSPAGLRDPRWAEVIFRTCVFATYAGRLDGFDPDYFPFLQIDSFACKRRHGSIDHFTAVTGDPIWRRLVPPFGWLCSCAVLPLLSCDVKNKKRARVSAEVRLGDDKIVRLTEWLEESPDTVFEFLLGGS